MSTEFMSAASTAAQQATVLAQQQEIAAQQPGIAAKQPNIAALQEVLTCGICMHGFDSGDRRPVVQDNCGHTVCLVCQNRIIQGNVRNCKCPMCREPFNSALKPTVNFSLIGLVDLLNEEKMEALLAAVQEALTCSICTNQFDSDDRRPVVQPKCGHTVCLVCQKRIIQGNVRNCTCPVCREPFNSALKPTCNFMLLAVVEMYQEVTMECESNDDILDLAVLLGDEDMPDLVQESEQERRFVEWHIALHGSGASSVPASEADASEADASDDVWDEWSDDDSNFLA